MISTHNNNDNDNNNNTNTTTTNNISIIIIIIIIITILRFGPDAAGEYEFGSSVDVDNDPSGAPRTAEVLSVTYYHM